MRRIELLLCVFCDIDVSGHTIQSIQQPIDGLRQMLKLTLISLNILNSFCGMGGRRG
jgi:hypothetical protein